MSTTFTKAAVERIAQCAGAVPRNDASTAEAVWTDYLDYEDRHLHRIGHYAFTLDPSVRELGFEVPLRLYFFAELLELAVVAGYVDLSEMDQRNMLRQALERLCDRVNGEGDLILVSDLVARLQDKAPLRVETRDDNAFHGYAAYLRLVDQVRSDVEFFEFLSRSDNFWRPNDDLGFLVSPRHFAEALVKGCIGGLKASDAGGGLRAMEYLVALHDLEQRFASVGGLWEKALRHARWSHRIDVTVRRLDLWRERMAEWLSADDEQEHEMWAVGLHALRRIEDQLSDMGLVTAQPYDKLVLFGPSVADLREFGRWGAAIKALRRRLNRALYPETFSGAAIESPTENRGVIESPPAHFVAYVDACLQLADLNKTDEAAAWLARVEPQLASFREIAPDLRQRAFAVLSDARQRNTLTVEENVAREQQARAADPSDWGRMQQPSYFHEEARAVERSSGTSAEAEAEE